MIYGQFCTKRFKDECFDLEAGSKYEAKASQLQVKKINA